MNPEKFIVQKVLDGLDGDDEALEKIADEIIDGYRKGKYECITEFIQQMRGKLCLMNGATVKAYMEASGMTEYKARKYLNNLVGDLKAYVETEKRPYIYKL